MRSKSIVLLTLALGCGLVASIGISQVMNNQNANDTPAPEMEPIIVAAKDITYNDKITPENIRLEEWPKSKIQAGVMTKLEDVVGKRPAHKIFAGEPILAGKLMGADGGGGAVAKIPKGYRVVSVRVDAVSGASSLILPDDRVDVLVYLARNPGTGILETSTKTILQDVRVFAIDTQFDRKTGSDEPAIAAKTISLLVTPAQAEKVTLATEMGQIRLVLRSPDDATESTAGGASIEDIFGNGEKNNPDDEQRKSQPPAPPAPAWTEQQKAQPPLAPSAPATQNWRMTLVEGSELRQVELAGDDQFPDVTETKIENFDTGEKTDLGTPAGELPPADGSSGSGSESSGSEGQGS